LLEECVGEQLCLMLGYYISEEKRRNPLLSIVPVKQPKSSGLLPDAWGHIACVSGLHLFLHGIESD
jgi:hypothetical protein